MTTPTVLERKTMGTAVMAVFACAASALVVVLLGSIPATYATTGVVALPLLFLLVGVVVAFLSVGYTAMARRVKHPAVYYAAITHGLGRPMGVAGGLVALLAYNAILTAQFGLFGFTAASLFGFGPWWMWALVAAAVVAAFGVRGIAAAAVFLTIIFGASLLVVVLFDSTALTHPAGGSLTSTGLTFAGLTGGLGGGVAYVIASLMGFELPGAFTEESRTSIAPGRALFIALTALVGIYTITAYAVSAGFGPDKLAAADPLAILDDQYGPVAPPWARFVLLMAIITSMLAFHSTVNRYTFAIAREGVLPGWLAHTGRDVRAASPVAASWFQTGISVVVILGFAVFQADPMATLFAWFSTLGALALLALLILTSLSAIIALRHRGPESESVWTWLVAPLLGLAGGVVIFGEMLFNLGALLGPDNNVTRWVIPAVVFAVALAGLIWAAYLRDARASVYQHIGRRLPDVNAVVDVRLSDLPL
jgi:amino acid transporter